MSFLEEQEEQEELNGVLGLTDKICNGYLLKENTQTKNEHLHEKHAIQ